jgi:hypothetical protein
MMQDRAMELTHARDHLQMHGGINALAMENKRLRERVAELEALVDMYENDKNIQALQGWD